MTAFLLYFSHYACLCYALQSLVATPFGYLNSFCSPISKPEPHFGSSPAPLCPPIRPALIFRHPRSLSFSAFGFLMMLPSIFLQSLPARSLPSLHRPFFVPPSPSLSVTLNVTLSNRRAEREASSLASRSRFRTRQSGNSVKPGHVWSTPNMERWVPSDLWCLNLIPRHKIRLFIGLFCLSIDRKLMHHSFFERHVLLWLPNGMMSSFDKWPFDIISIDDTTVPLIQAGALTSHHRLPYLLWTWNETSGLVD